jgi:toxin HigB-1
LELLFATPALRALCLDELVASRSLDATAARRLRARLDDLDAAACLAVVAKLAGRLHRRGLDGHFALTVIDGIELVIAPADDPLPYGDDGEVRLDKVTRVKVISIGRPHA